MWGRSYPRMRGKLELGMMSHTRVTSSFASWISRSALVAGFGVTVLAIVSVFASPPAAVAEFRSAAESPTHPYATSQPDQAGVEVSNIAGAPRALWLGPNGQPLPFSTHAEVVEFLKTAEVVSKTEIPDGSTRPDKLLLEKDGVQLHAIFRSFLRVQERTADPRTGQFIAGEAKDSAMFEAAAYELAMMFDLPLIPPTVRRIINNRDGTLQLWIETAMTETKRREMGIEPPNSHWWSGIMQSLRIWDDLIYNADRNTGNFLIDPDWGVWFVDHTRAFQIRRDLRNLESITFCERLLWERLRTLTSEEINTRMALYLDGREIGALLKRRERIVKHIEKLIEENGVDAVIFRYSHDIADWSRSGPQ